MLQFASRKICTIYLLWCDLIKCAKVYHSVPRIRGTFGMRLPNMHEMFDKNTKCTTDTKYTMAHTRLLDVRPYVPYQQSIFFLVAVTGTKKDMK